MNTRALQLAMGVVLGLLVALVATSRIFLEDRAGPEDGHLLAEPFPAPALDLKDPDGAPWSVSTARGAVVAVFFGYTHCPDVCPLTLARLGRYQEDRGSGEVPLQVVFVSVDPERDTPRRLREFAAGLPGSVVAVSAAEADVREQASAWGVMVLEREEPTLPQGDYLVDHTARTYILDPRGMVVSTLPPMASSEEVSRVLDAVFASLE